MVGLHVTWHNMNIRVLQYYGMRIAGKKGLLSKGYLRIVTAKALDWDMNGLVKH